MAMVLSKACDYGLRAVLYVAAQQDREVVPIREMSERLNISFHFLTKILQTLTQQGLIQSFKGPRGGIRLSKPAESIRLMDVITAIDGDALFTECVLGLNRCGDDHPCPLHGKWAPIRDRLADLFRTATVAEMAAKVKEMDYRLTDLLQGDDSTSSHFS